MIWGQYSLDLWFKITCSLSRDSSWNTVNDFQVSVWAYLYICICVFVYLCICVFVYLYICICICVFVYLSICIFVYLYICIFVYLYICICICVFVFAFVFESILVFVKQFWNLRSASIWTIAWPLSTKGKKSVDGSDNLIGSNDEDCKYEKEFLQ